MSHPREIPSAISDNEADALTKLADHKVVLEIGADYGFSTIVLARSALVVHSVDWFRGDAHTGERNTLPIYWDNLMRHGVRDKVIVHIGDSQEVVSMLPKQHFDMAFIDAFHEEEAVHRDLTAALRRVRDGGVVALHDWNDHFGVKAAVTKVAARHEAEVHVIDTLAWFLKK